MSATPEPEIGLTLALDRGDTQATITVGGELEFGTAGILRTTLLDLSHDRVALVTLDLAGVEFIDSTGISLLVQAKQRFENQGGRFVLRALNSRVSRVLEIAGLDGLFDVEA